MVSLLEYIGNTINNLNTGFNSYKSNGVQLPSGEVIEFTDQKEKQFIGIGDCYGEAFYIRSNPQITYLSEKRLTSTQTTSSAVKVCRLVAYSWKEKNSESMMNKLTTDLKAIRFNNFPRNTRPQITIKRSNHNYMDNVKEELKKELKDVPAEFVCVSIDFELKYYPAVCECEEETLTNCEHD